LVLVPTDKEKIVPNVHGDMGLRERISTKVHEEAVRESSVFIASAGWVQREHVIGIRVKDVRAAECRTAGYRVIE
jgi:hypothetical protein